MVVLFTLLSQRSAPSASQRRPPTSTCYQYLLVQFELVKFTFRMTMPECSSMIEVKAEISQWTRRQLTAMNPSRLGSVRITDGWKIEIHIGPKKSMSSTNSRILASLVSLLTPAWAHFVFPFSFPFLGLQHRRRLRDSSTQGGIERLIKADKRQSNCLDRECVPFAQLELRLDDCIGFGRERNTEGCINERGLQLMISSQERVLDMYTEDDSRCYAATCLSVERRLPSYGRDSHPGR